MKVKKRQSGDTISERHSEAHIRLWDSHREDGRPIAANISRSGNWATGFAIGTSIGANVQEADAAESKKDFVHKLGIARKEAQETRYWLGIIRAAILPNDAKAEALWKESDGLVRILYAIIKNTRIKQFTAPAARVLSFVIGSFVIYWRGL
jgi:hypothetical protein